MADLNNTRRKAGQNGRLAALAEAQGITLEALLVNAIEKNGSLEAAARALEVNRNTLRHYLNKFGYELSTKTELRRVGA